MSNGMREVATTIYEDNSHMKEIALYLSDRVSNILKNMQAIMLNFGKTCKLDFIEHKDDNSSSKDVLFVITSEDSDYAEVVGGVQLSNDICLQNMIELENVVQHLSKLNPDETNVNFRIMKRHGIYDHRGDSFAPEKRIWFLEDRLKITSGTLS